MALDDLENDIRAHIAASSGSSLIRSCIETDSPGARLYVIQHCQPSRLPEILKSQRLFASDTPGFTWGDAIYVAPLNFPQTTMMYGAAGVIGWIDSSEMRFYNAVDSSGVTYYQQWITYQSEPYRQLTTTVHSNEANSFLRNAFRTRFGIGCIYFRPDETCPGYTDPRSDLWLAITHWNDRRMVASGPSDRVKELQWCAIGTESFERETSGYRAILSPELLQGRTIVHSSYKDLRERLRAAYLGKKDVLITEF